MVETTRQSIITGRRSKSSQLIFKLAAIWLLLLAKGQYRDGFSEWERAPSAFEEPEQIKAIGETFFKSGYREAIKRAITDVERSKTEYVSPYYIAILYALIGENDNAFKWLNKAYEVNDEALPMMKVEPGLRSPRYDPRYADLLRRMGLPQ